MWMPGQHVLECSGHEQSSKSIVSVARLPCAVWFEGALDAGMQAGHTQTYAEHWHILVSVITVVFLDK